jgi:DNA-binding NarL/FixJ family response regulator
LVVIGEAGSGEQALALADAMEIDLMLVDVGMKGMNGIQLASALLARHPHIKVLMLSTYGQPPPRLRSERVPYRRHPLGDLRVEFRRKLL